MGKFRLSENKKLKFNGELFANIDARTKKAEAEKEAEKLRDRGFHVRVTPYYYNIAGEKSTRMYGIWVKA